VRTVHGGSSRRPPASVMAWKRMVVVGLNQMCVLVDDVVYRPAIVRLTLRLPRWWRCELGQLSVWLDERWGIGYWQTDDQRTLAPGDLCDVCGRRPAHLEVGGLWEDVEPEGDFMESHPLRLCFWCQLDAPIESEEQLSTAIADARACSIAWRWRWHPMPN